MSSEADAVVLALLAPIAPDAFFAAVEASTPLDHHGGPTHSRAALLGPDPETTLLAAYATHATILDCHAVAPVGPRPALAPVADAAAFRALIGDYHDLGYTVRIPEVRALAAPLLTFTRALEVLLCQPVEVSAFWSGAGARAKIHYDNNDNITVQLAGKKRWYVSTDPAGLQNAWHQAGEPLPQLDRHCVIDAEPGDLVFIPRGTPHTVASTTDSIHVSILFTPLTLRAAIIAALDHLSDLARPYRATARAREPRAPPTETAIGSDLLAGLETLIAQCRDHAFIEAALAKRSSLTVGKLTRLAPTVSPPALTLASRVRHAPLSIAHLRDAGSVIDLALPGGHISLHPGAGRALAFIMATPDFAIGEMPDLGGEVAVALVDRLVRAGLLTTRT